MFGFPLCMCVRLPDRHMHRALQTQLAPCHQSALTAVLALPRRVGMEQPSVELRFQNLHIETSLYSDSGRNLPTVFNAYRNVFEVSSAMAASWHMASVHVAAACPFRTMFGPALA